MKSKTKEEMILTEISNMSKNKDILWYKEELKKHNIQFIEVIGENHTIVVPECIYNKWSKVKQKKLYKGAF